MKDESYASFMSFVLHPLMKDESLLPLSVLSFIPHMKDKSHSPFMQFALHPPDERQISCFLYDFCLSSPQYEGPLTSLILRSLILAVLPITPFICYIEM